MVSVTFDDAFAVHEIKVVEGKKGLFIAMPSQVSPEGIYQDIVHPISQEARDSLSKAVFDAFHLFIIESKGNKEC